MNSPQSTDSNLTPWCLFWSSWATQFIYFHYSQHTSQIDGIEDCGEQLPYKDINGSLYYFLETLCLFSDQIILRLLFVAYCTHPFFRNREIFLFCFTLHRSNHKFFSPSTLDATILSIPFLTAWRFFWILFSPTNLGDNTPSANRHSGQKIRTISIRSKPIWCFPFARIFN